MKNYDHISLTEVHYPQDWCCDPQTFTVPKGCQYIHGQYAFCDTDVDLCCSGEWLEIIDEEKGLRIRYVLDEEKAEGPDFLK